MRGLTYFDLILHVEIANKKTWNARSRERVFSVQVFDSPAGQQPEPCTSSFPKYEEFSQQVIPALNNREYGRSLAEQTNLGKQLADALFPEPARTLFWESLDQLEPGDGLRLRLRLPPQLAGLPWEFLYMPERAGGTGRFLALDPRLSIVRHEELPIPVNRPTPREKLHIVVAMASPETTGRLIDLPKEQQSIWRALHNMPGVDVDYCPDYGETTISDDMPIPSATREDLERVLKGNVERKKNTKKTRGTEQEGGTDVFQFSGHGNFRTRSGYELDTERGIGYLVLADKYRYYREITAADLAGLLKGVRLIYLSACETAARTPYQEARGLTVELLGYGFPCILAMQFPVDSDLAAAFTATLYQTLVTGRTIDEAVQQGRAAMYARGRKERYLAYDWAVPVLYSRVPNGDLFRPILEKNARDQAERLVEQRARLNQAWWDWTGDDDTLASRGQLNALEEAAHEVELSPYQLLFLLRSAAKEAGAGEEISATIWLGSEGRDEPQRKTQEAIEWLTNLDDPGSLTLEDMPAEARSILGLGSPLTRERPETVGRVAWQAVAHPDLLTRQTAALALATLGSKECLKRLDGAIGAINTPGQRWWRRSELRGTLVELDPKHAADYARSLSPLGRIGLWGWRVVWHVHRDRRLLGGLLAGGTIGAGVGLGLLRLILALSMEIGFLQSTQSALMMVMYFFWGSLFGVLPCAGMLLANPLLLQPLRVSEKTQTKEAGPDAASGPPASSNAPRPSQKTPHRWVTPRFLLTIVLGTLGAGIALMLESTVNAIELPLPALVIPLGFLFGLGLSLALYGNPLAVWRPGFGRNLWRPVVAAATSVLTQLIFTGSHLGLAIAIVWPGIRYSEWLGDPFDLLWPNLAKQCPLWSQYLGLVDAALVGVFLWAGIALGVRVAARRTGLLPPVRPAKMAGDKQ